MNNNPSRFKIHDMVYENHELLWFTRIINQGSQLDSLCLAKDVHLRQYFLDGFIIAGTNFTEGLTLILEHVVCSVVPQETRVLLFSSTTEKIEMLRKALTDQKFITVDQQQFTRLLDDYKRVEKRREELVGNLDLRDTQMHGEDIIYLTHIMEKAFRNLETAISVAFIGYESCSKYPFSMNVTKVVDTVTFAKLAEKHGENLPKK
jgi:hypothetical protein